MWLIDTAPNSFIGATTPGCPFPKIEVARIMVPTAPSPNTNPTPTHSPNASTWRCPLPHDRGRTHHGTPHLHADHAMDLGSSHPTPSRLCQVPIYSLIGFFISLGSNAAVVTDAAAAAAAAATLFMRVDRPSQRSPFDESGRTPHHLT
jgi:hypothetical protein